MLFVYSYFCYLQNASLTSVVIWFISLFLPVIRLPSTGAQVGNQLRFVFISASSFLLLRHIFSLLAFLFIFSFVDLVAERWCPLLFEAIFHGVLMLHITACVDSWQTGEDRLWNRHTTWKCQCYSRWFHGKKIMHKVGLLLFKMLNPQLQSLVASLHIWPQWWHSKGN